MRVADDLGYAGKRGDFLGRALRVAAGDDDLTIGVFAMHTADGGARILIGGGGYGAGIEDDDFRRGRRQSTLHPELAELALDGRAIGLSRPASEVLYVKGSHALLY